MPHALLLSPDDQAVSAITAVLEEMSVTCERPLDGPSAAKKLNSQSFDLVLVDCENLPAAKLIFDVCRRSQAGTNPVPIAIVDGRAGLPTAFRLGAELILTKPVAKDQARTTIRTAVGRVKKDETARPIHPFEEPAAQAATPEKDTQAAAAAAGATSAIASSEIAHSSAGSPTAKMSSATEEISATPAALKSHSALISEKPATSSIPATDMFMPATKPIAVPPSDDPILADLESDSPTPVFTSYVEPQKKKTRGSLVALLLLAIIGGGSYAAWMYQPGVREFVEPQINRLMGLIASLRATQQSSSPQPVQAPVASVPQPAPVKAEANSDTAAPGKAESTSNSIPASTESTAPASAGSGTTTPAASSADAAKSGASTDSTKNVATNLPTDTELPGEKTAIILSSQGAEKRLIRHLQPGYPAEARKAGIEGTVVLKAVVSENGAVEGVRLVEGNPALAAAAITSVKQWHYRPYLRDGKALPFQTIVLVEFQRP
jgi:protein TonB